jgi:hypothetical protein
MVLCTWRAQACGINYCSCRSDHPPCNIKLWLNSIELYTFMGYIFWSCRNTLKRVQNMEYFLSSSWLENNIIHIHIHRTNLSVIADSLYDQTKHCYCYNICVIVLALIVYVHILPLISLSMIWENLFVLCFSDANAPLFTLDKGMHWTIMFSHEVTHTSMNCHVFSMFPFPNRCPFTNRQPYTKRQPFMNRCQFLHTYTHAL